MGSLVFGKEMKVITFKLTKKNATFSLVFALVFINQISTKAEEIHFKEKESKINFELSIPLQPIDDFQISHQEDSLEDKEDKSFLLLIGIVVSLIIVFYIIIFTCVCGKKTSFT